jgi:hypothetical protein
MPELEYFIDKEFLNINFARVGFAPGEYENRKFEKCTFFKVKLCESVFIIFKFNIYDFTNCNISTDVFQDV